MRKKAILLTLLFGIALALVGSFAIDRVAGIFLNRLGYFLLQHPSIRELYDTAEFTITADISSQGIRNDTVRIPKPEGVYRIVAIGDSFTFGWGAQDQDTWVRLLEKKLQSSSKKVELINVGAPGLGPDGYVLACEAYARQFAADAIIIGFYGTDDLYQAASWKQNRNLLDVLVGAMWPMLSRIGNRVIIEPWYSGERPGETMVISSVWSHWVKNYFISKPAALSRLDIELRNLLISGKINPSLLRGAAQDPEYLVKLLDEKNMAYAVGATGTLLRDFKRSCSHALPVFVVYLPSNETVSDYFLPFRAKFGFQVDPRLITFRPDETIDPVVRSLGFDYLSLLPEFRSEPCISCFYPFDIHMTPAGNQKVADLVGAYILGHHIFGL